MVDIFIAKSKIATLSVTRRDADSDNQGEDPLTEGDA
jgi:hypothetical protein